MIAKAMKNLSEMTEEEDRAITGDALRDPDSTPIDDFSTFMNWDEYLKAHGKATVTLDLDVVERFRKAGGDWEGRINTALRSVAPAE